MISFEMKVTLILSIIFAARIYQLTALDEKCITETKYGVVTGKSMVSRNGREFCAFLGIPYAAPPTGILRFMPPVSLQPWEGIRDCQKESEKCLQKEGEGSEDCLHLNIFTHNKQTNSSLTVMVYIHGGGFFMGSSALSFLGPEYLMDKSIVLVTIQYRLGPFGFLSTEDEVIPGNMGLKDQVKAFQWVQENIDVFGGDISKVTIFGNSAGGASVHYHMISPMSKPLFARAISQSGTALSSFALSGKGRSRKDTKRLAFELNCSVESSSEILDCLQSRNASEVLRVFLKHLKSKYGDRNKLFRPVVEVNNEQSFITEYPGKFKTTKPWLVGLNANEGAWKIDSKINKYINYILTDFKNFGPFMTQTGDLYSNLDEITNLTYKFYFENASLERIITSFEQITTDSWFAWPTEQAIKNHNGSLYYYLYDHRAKHTYVQMYGLKQIRPGVVHTDELLMLFTQKDTFPFLDNEDGKISKLMVDLWTNFASEGNPTPSPINSDPQNDSFETVVWLESGNADPTYFHITTNMLQMEKKLFSERMDFWRGIDFRKIE